jgi:glycosyltransferase involved in cell wall biosynthesis
VASAPVLFIANDPVGAELGGNAIRAYELARAVGARRPVVLAAPAGRGTPPADVRLEWFEPGQPEALRPLITAADTIVCPPQGALVTSWLRRARARLVFDLYDPGAIEALAIHARAGRARRALWTTAALDQLLDALHLGSHFVCATERQRDLWIGAMLASRLLSPAVYDADPSLRSVIDVVPFGVPETPPVRAGGGARARFPQLPEDAELVLWNGGIWNWLDPETVVRAAAKLAARRPPLRLVFMGRPPLRDDDARAAVAARELAARLDVLDRTVFFNDAWVPYAERSAWLLDADCAVSAHGEHLETRFAFRTRLLDCLWARLPIVCTGGDELADRIERDGLGAVVPPGDVDALAAALERVLDRGREDFRTALDAAARAFAWPSAAAPLVRYVTAPPDVPRLGAGWSRRAARPVQSLRGLGVRAAKRLGRLLR